MNLWTAEIFALLLLEAPAPRRFDPDTTSDLLAIAQVLKKHIVRIEVTLATRPNSLQDETRDGFGVAINPNTVVALSHLVENAGEIRILGPTKYAIEARVVVYDPPVAALEVLEPLTKVGTVPAKFVSHGSVNIDDPVFALTDIDPLAGTITGVISFVDPTEPDHLKTSLKLAHGMPIFDREARLLGYSRTLVWDPDPFLVVSTEAIEKALAKGRALSQKHRNHGR